MKSSEYGTHIEEGRFYTNRYRNGRFHCEDGPARVCVVDAGYRRYATYDYFINGYLHNSNGPAKVTTLTSGENACFYFLYGHRISYSKWRFWSYVGKIFGKDRVKRHFEKKGPVGPPMGL